MNRVDALWPFGRQAKLCKGWTRPEMFKQHEGARIAVRIERVAERWQRTTPCQPVSDGSVCAHLLSCCGQETHFRSGATMKRTCQGRQTDKCPPKNALGWSCAPDGG